ncbi:hypothetical protein JTF08_11085 [Micrococcaceae bacterium RIT802]|nr:hypothetical protein [Micrococcaceae bacterium RIT 802]
MSEDRQHQPTALERFAKISRAIFDSVLSVVLFMVGLPFGWTPAVASACTSTWGNRFALVQKWCGEEYNQIDTASARTAIMRYYGQAGGAEPRRAWLLLTDAQRDRVPLDDFDQLWAPYSWAEVISDIQTVEKRHNVFQVDVRHYEGFGDTSMPSRGRLVDYRILVGLESINGALRISEEIVDRRLATQLANYPRRGIAPHQKTYNTALQDDENVAMQASRDEAGGLLSLLCTLDEPTTSPDNSQDGVRSWFRTPQGWLPTSGVPDFDRRTLQTCSDAYAGADS